MPLVLTTKEVAMIERKEFQEKILRTGLTSSTHNAAASQVRMSRTGSEPNKS